MQNDPSGVNLVNVHVRQNIIGSQIPRGAAVPVHNLQLGIPPFEEAGTIEPLSMGSPEGSFNELQRAVGKVKQPRPMTSTVHR